MLQQATFLLVLALIAALAGFSGLTPTVAGPARVFFFVFIALFLASALAGAFRGNAPV